MRKVIFGLATAMLLLTGAVSTPVFADGNPPPLCGPHNPC